MWELVPRTSPDSCPLGRPEPPSVWPSDKGVTGDESQLWGSCGGILGPDPIQEGVGWPSRVGWGAGTGPAHTARGQST